MGTYYSIYAEGKVSDTWHALGPFVLDTVCTPSLVPLYWAQSIVRELYLDLEEYSISRGVPEDASEQLFSIFRPLDEQTTGFWGKQQTWREYYRQCVFTVDFDSAIASRIIPGRMHSHQGYVYRELIPDYECGDCDSIEYWLTEREYYDLPKDERKAYAYYEWDNWGDSYGILREIYSRVSMLKSWFKDNRWHMDKDMSFGELESMPVRLIIEAS